MEETIKSVKEWEQGEGIKLASHIDNNRVVTRKDFEALRDDVGFTTIVEEGEE